MFAHLRYYTKDYLKLGWKYCHLLKSTETPVLVLTMAKVGSSSVYHSLRKNSNIPCFHIHSLSWKEIKNSNQLVFDAGMVPDSRSPVRIINEQILDKKRPFKVISLFRNPVERNISAFFDAFQLLVGLPPEQYKGSIDELLEIYYEKLLHEYPLTWFDQHFLPGTGIDVYKHPFDPSVGALQVDQGNCSVLLMNSAMNNRQKEKLIGDFLMVEPFHLINVNVTAESKANSLYDAFKSQVRFEKSYLDTLLGSKYFKHFFSVQQQAGTRKRWQKIS